MPETKKVIILGIGNLGIATVVANELERRRGEGESNASLPGEEHTNIVTAQVLDPSSFNPVPESERVLTVISRKGVGPTEDG